MHCTVWLGSALVLSVQKFQGVATSTPGCVLRYSRDAGAEPCWGRSSPLPGDIPPCPRCGASRIFEFQIMPQLLAFLGIDDMAEHAPDWCAPTPSLECLPLSSRTFEYCAWPCLHRHLRAGLCAVCEDASGEVIVHVG